MIKIGDTVEVINREDIFFGKIGIAKEPVDMFTDFEVFFDDGQSEYYRLNELIKVIPKKSRGFQRVKGYDGIPLPIRATKYSAGYDIASATDVTIAPNETTVISTGIKAYMQDNEYLALYVRSSIGKLGLSMVTGVSVIDSDYYDNPKNEGHIYVMLRNDSCESQHIAKGTRVVQGIFHSYLCIDDDNVTTVRVGGTGSTD